MKAFRKIYARNGFKTLDRIWIGDLKECQEAINLDIERFESVGYRKISDRILSRECKDYWIDRFAGHCGQYEYFFGPKGREMRMAGNFNYDKLVFTLGYPKADDTSRRLEFKNPKIRIGTGRPEWGAEPGKNYFIITWEK